MGIADRYWMQKAFEFALQAEQLNEVPVGAVVVLNDELIGSGFNRVINHHNPTAHAELTALKQAALSIKNYRLLNCTLYVTLEPCAMCAAALVHARIARLVFATRDFKTGAAGSRLNLINGPASNHFIQVDEGIMQNDCSQLLSRFFKARRTTC